MVFISGYFLIGWICGDWTGSLRNLPDCEHTPSPARLHPLVRKLQTGLFQFLRQPARTRWTDVMKWNLSWSERGWRTGGAVGPSGHSEAPTCDDDEVKRKNIGVTSSWFLLLSSSHTTLSEKLLQADTWIKSWLFFPFFLVSHSLSPKQTQKSKPCDFRDGYLNGVCVKTPLQRSETSCCSALQEECFHWDHLKPLKLTDLSSTLNVRGTSKAAVLWRSEQKVCYLNAATYWTRGGQEGETNA